MVEGQVMVEMSEWKLIGKSERKKIWKKTEEKNFFLNKADNP